MLKAKVLLVEPVTHDVKRFILEKPKGYKFTPGQAINIAINKPELAERKHEFTFTSLNQDEVLEFIIKRYPVSEFPNHKGITEKLHTLVPGDTLLIEEEPWGTISYKGSGVFIAAGAGITPFIAILKDLYKSGKMKGNKLLYANKTKKDIIYEKVWEAFFDPQDYINILSREEAPGYEHGHIDKAFLQKHIENFDTNFLGEAASYAYVCGPHKFTDSINEILGDLGAKSESIVFEK